MLVQPYVLSRSHATIKGCPKIPSTYRYYPKVQLYNINNRSIVFFLVSAQFMISQHRQEKHVPWSWSRDEHLLRVPVVRHPCDTSSATVTCHVDDVTVSRCNSRHGDRGWQEVFSFDANQSLFLETEFSPLGAYMYMYTRIFYSRVIIKFLNF